MSKPKPAVPSTPVRTDHMCVLIAVYNCGRPTQYSTDNPPDNHHSSDNLYQTGGSYRTNGLRLGVQYSPLVR